MIGQRLGQYEIIELLGRGGMGEVYRARDSRLERDVAIKLLAPEQTRDERAKQRFVREARTASALDHPNICSIYQIEETDDGRLYIVMAFYPGRTLTAHQSNRPIPVDETLAIAGQIASGVARAHVEGIIHRDLKPANVMLTDEGLAKILDFGLAKSNEDETITRTGAAMGTPAYMSPEQIRAGGLDARSDLWSLCVMIYEMLTGRSPFLRDGVAQTLSAILHDEPRDVRELVTGVPEPVADFVMRGLDKNVENRPESLDPLLATLGLPAAGAPSASIRSISDETVDLAHVTSPFRTTSPPRQRPRWLGFALVALLVGAGSVAVWQWLQRPAPLLRVAVVAPEILAQDDAVRADIARVNLETAIARALGGLENVAVTPVKSTGDDVATIALENAVDEVFLSRAVHGGADWNVQLSRMNPDGSVRWTQQFRARDDDDVDFASAVVAMCGEGFSERRSRRGSSAAKVRPEDYLAYLELVEEWERLPGRNELDRMLLRIRQLTTTSPQFPDPFLLDARISRHVYESTREDAYAESAKTGLETFLRLTEGGSRGLRERFELGLRLNDLELAEDATRDLADSQPGNPELAAMRGKLAQARGNHEEALRQLKEAVRRQPSVQHLDNLADLQYQQNMFEDARATLQRSLGVQPGNLWAQGKLGEIELLHGSASEAARIFADLADKSGHISDWANLGLAQQLLGDFASAEQSFRRSESLAPEHPYILLNLADCITAQGRKLEAESIYLAVSRQFEDSERTLDWSDRLVLAQCQAQLGEFSSAVTHTQRALQDGADEAEAYYMASLVYCLTGSDVPALVNAKEALTRGYNPRWFGLPWFDRLREDPEFTRLTQTMP
jgi:serine/threonine-protein kinase